MHRFLPLFLVLILASCSGAKQAPTTQFRGAVFGTTYQITYASSAHYHDDIHRLFDQMNASLSTYINSSLISRINAGDSTVVVDTLFAEVFEKSRRIYRETAGYFDPSVGPLVNAWGFGPGELVSMDSLKVAALMTGVGFEKVDLAHNKVTFSRPEMYLDFNSIAKGFGIDVVARFLDAKGIRSYLIEIGGEIRTKGLKPNGLPWKVAIEKPVTDGSQSFQHVISLTDVSMATSGNYRKFRVSPSGEKYVHTINPKTGFAFESTLLSATVIAPIDCADVDAYATAFMAMGLDKTKAFLKIHPNLQVILLYADGSGGIATYTTYEEP